MITANKRTSKDDGESEENTSLAMGWREICHRQKGLMAAMILLAVLGAVMFLISLSALRPQNTVVIVGYSDVYGEIVGISGGYKRSSWMNMLAFPILAVVFGVLHNLIAIRIYKKYGRDVALMIVLVTILLIIIALIVLFRLMGEW